MKQFMIRQLINFQILPIDHVFKNGIRYKTDYRSLSMDEIEKELVFYDSVV